MGIALELMLMAPGETPEETISRCFHDVPRLIPATPWTPDEGWQEPLIETTAAVFEWNRDDENGTVYFWHPDVGWQVEFYPSGVLFRRRRGVPDTVVSPAEILRVFCGIPAVLYCDDDNWWTLPATVPDDVSMYG
ncbi:MAG: hypothetical protein ACI9C1_002864 [Candidatus Aldehydirespiratoraceae bacterium]|jgi:hypothetical protein